MYLNQPFSEPIETVNAQVVAVYPTSAQAEAEAHRYFHETMGLVDNGESENGGYYYCASDHGGDSGTWDEEVYVEEMTVRS